MPSQGGAEDCYAVIPNAEQGLVVVEHPDAFAEDLPPEGGMGALAGAAGGGEEIADPVHAEGGAVHQQHVIIRQPLGQEPMEGQTFQGRAGALVGAASLRSVLAVSFRLGPLQVGFSRREIEQWRTLRQVVPEQQPCFRIRAGDSERDPRELCAKLFHNTLLCLCGLSALGGESWQPASKSQSWVLAAGFLDETQQPEQKTFA